MSNAEAVVTTLVKTVYNKARFQICNKTIEKTLFTENNNIEEHQNTDKIEKHMTL